MAFQNPITGGVLLIGSLYWESDEIRENWRSERLDITNARRISLPIRYGRISRRRYRTYSMVYSSTLPHAKWGTGYLVPFRHNSFNEVSEIRNETDQMIRVERKFTSADWEAIKRYSPYYNWDWGAIGLVLNENVHGSVDDGDAQQLLRHWKESYSPDYTPENYSLYWEQPMLSPGGVLSLQLPGMSEYDFLLTTVVQPNTGKEKQRYPEAREIAEVMYRTNCYTYFLQSIRTGISTFQDREILRYLQRDFNVLTYIEEHNLETAVSSPK